MMNKIILSFKYYFQNRKTHIEKYGIFDMENSKSGYVLVIVLITTAMLLMIFSDFMLTSSSSLNFALKIKNEAIAEQITYSGLQLSEYLLEADMKGLSSVIGFNEQTDKNTDSFHDLWAYSFDEIPLENGTLSIEINDAQAKINLCAITNKYVKKSPYYSITNNFFNSMNLDQNYVDSIVDWIDPDDDPSSYGGEDYDYYSTLPYKYYCKNGPLDSIDELLLIKNFTPKIYYGLYESDFIEEHIQKVNSNKIIKSYNSEDDSMIDNETIGIEVSNSLQNYFRVFGNNEDYLNETNKINVNTASYRVLSALTDDITDDIVVEIIRLRQEKPIKNLNELKNLITDSSVRNNLLTVRSYIYEIKIISNVNGYMRTINAVYNRASKRYYYFSIE